MLGYLLHRHGRVALHASVLAWDGAAFVFAGRPGAGKSTLAAALAQRGAPAISDDVAAVTGGPRAAGSSFPAGRAFA